MDLDELKENCGRAIDLEIRSVRQELARIGADRPVPVKEIVRVGGDANATEYQCEGPEDRCVAEHTPLRLVTDGGAHKGELVSYDPDTGSVRFVLVQDAGERMAEGLLEFDSTFLLEALREALQALHPDDHGVHLASAGLGGGRESIAPLTDWLPDERLNEAQNDAVRSALSGSVTHIWGPPGTGKTRTLASLLELLLRAGKKCLVAAPTNVAVDNLARALLGRGGSPLEDAQEQGLIIRIGYPAPDLRSSRVHLNHAFQRTAEARTPEILTDIEHIWRETESVLGRRLADDETREDMPARARFWHAQRMAARFAGDGERALRLLARIERLAERVSEVERLAVERAVLVFSTLTKLTLPGLLEDLVRSAVVIDEVSMVPFPLYFVGAARASQCVISAGDFQQLPPIFLSPGYEVRRWYGQNVYSMASLDDPWEDFPVRPLLDTQYRMHPSIAAVVSRFFYAERLVNGERPIGLARGGPSERLVLVDTSTLDATSERTDSGSRLNERHAELAVSMVEDLVASGWLDLGVICPYAAQAALIREKLKAALGTLPVGVEVSTIHRFQGREKDFIVFDLVDAPPLSTHFLNEVTNPGASKLINVALSRAREHVVVLAHAEHFDRAVPMASTIPRLLAHMRLHGIELDAEEWDSDAPGEWFPLGGPE